MWIIDDLSPLHQYKTEISKADIYLFKPLDAYRMGGVGGFFRGGNSLLNGINHPGGALFSFYLPDSPGKNDTITLTVHEASGKLIKSFSTNPKEGEEGLSVKKGSNKFNWNLRYPNAKGFDGLVMWAGSLAGPMAAPGDYQVKLNTKKGSVMSTFKVLQNPNSTRSAEDIQKQVDFINQNNQKLTETHQTITDIRALRTQLSTYKEKINDDPNMRDVLMRIKTIDSSMTVLEESLYQTKNRSNQDPLNFPVRLNNKLAYLNSISNKGDFPPTLSSYTVQTEMVTKINENVFKWQDLLNKEVPALNELIKSKAIDPISIKKLAKP